MANRLEAARKLVHDSENPIWQAYPSTTRTTALNCEMVVGVSRCKCPNMCSLANVRRDMVTELERRLADESSRQRSDFSGEQPQNL